MKCTRIKDGVEVCVTVNVKLIYPAPPGGDIRTELARNEAIRKAQYIGTKCEQQIVETIKQQMIAEDLGIQPI
jgi:hypothetical protein